MSWHCGHVPASRPRGLCWHCYYTPGVRDQYTTTSKFGRRGVVDAVGIFVLPPSPTRALPGTPEKVAVLIDRAIKHQCLFHPYDAPAIDPATLLAAIA